MSEKSFIHPELQIPEWGTPEFYEWWESQYDRHESIGLDSKLSLSYLEWADGFVGK